MEALAITCVFFILFIFWVELKSDIKTGIALIVLMVGCFFLAISGGRFGFDGEIASLIFAGLFAAAYHAVKYISNGRQK